MKNCHQKYRFQICPIGGFKICIQSEPTTISAPYLLLYPRGAEGWEKLQQRPLITNLPLYVKFGTKLMGIRIVVPPFWVTYMFSRGVIGGLPKMLNPFLYPKSMLPNRPSICKTRHSKHCSVIKRAILQ